MLDVGKLSKRYPGLIPDFAMWKAETISIFEWVPAPRVTLSFARCRSRGAVREVRKLSACPKT